MPRFSSTRPENGFVWRRLLSKWVRSAPVSHPRRNERWQVYQSVKIVVNTELAKISDKIGFVRQIATTQKMGSFGAGQMASFVDNGFVRSKDVELGEPRFASNYSMKWVRSANRNYAENGFVRQIATTQKMGSFGRFLVWSTFQSKVTREIGIPVGTKQSGRPAGGAVVFARTPTGDPRRDIP